ncbi:MAG: NAD(P)H-dependent oxidoreductase [Sphaerochaeta sp.]|jgi:nitroreductase|uniref:NAD(P)H-dependent oxidoreductase n=1 Tax=Sphaerochaeta sp. TaxID=1972642 RepID=UPI002FC5DDF2
MECIDAMRRRFACKVYDVKRLLDDEQIRQILEFGRLTPTSFGLELWSFHVVTTAALKARLQKACFDQEGVGTSAMTVAVLVRTAAYADPDGNLVRQRSSRFPDPLDQFIEDYRPYHAFLKQEGRLDCWLCSQGYLAIANMMTGAASLGIQSCAIEGFDEAKVLEVLGIDDSSWQVSLLATFGYPGEAERPKIRQSQEDLVVYH